MELHLRVALACISSFLCFQCSSCGELLDGSGTIKWSCICASAPTGTPNFSPASNCSTACDCRPEAAAGGPNAEGWTCSCAPDEVPQTSSIHDASCFTACNCTSGSSSTAVAAKKRISNKAVVVTLLLCVLLTTIALITSLTCYFYRKDRCSMQSPVYSSDRDTSWNSATGLISHRTASTPEFQVSHFNSVTGFIRRASFMFSSRKGTLPGIIVQFSYHELELATDKFSNSNLIGLGGSSNVYRGQLKDGRLVAIKRIKMLGASDVDSGFLTEIELISRLNHCHVVPLFGYCLESKGKHFERLLVFEYMSNGNLRDCLDVEEGKPMDWQTRVSIALGAARGLEYLHEAAAPRILHRDIKSTNILLDDKYRAKITDLGMAKHLITDDLTGYTSSPARMLGTFGYFAPEYAIVGKASLKSDVFSFGVVILELITGRKPIRKSSDKADESLVIWATPRLQNSRLVVSELPDPFLKGNFPEEEMQVMARLARECLQWDPDSRPSMSEVVQILSTISPDKEKRRNFSANFFSSPSSRILKVTVENVRPEELSEGSAEKVDSMQASLERLNTRCSFSSAVDRDARENQLENEDTVLSADYMERLILLTSNTRSWRAPDDEIVDLTEPRFEAFLQANTLSL